MRACPRCGKQLAGSVSRHLRNVHEEAEEVISAFVKASLSSGGFPETDAQRERAAEGGQEGYRNYIDYKAMVNARKIKKLLWVAMEHHRSILLEYLSQYELLELNGGPLALEKAVFCV